MKVSRFPPVVLIDTREQRPLLLPNAQRATLRVGDYSLEGFTDSIAVERKSLADLFGCIGRERTRFERELNKLAKLRYPAIVIEATMAEILAGAEFSEVHPHSAIGSLIAWGTKYRIPCWLCGSRRMAAATVYKILLKGAKYGNKSR